MLNFYDFEVTSDDWLVVIINPYEKKVTKIANDKRALLKYFDRHKHELWVGYNNRRYDQYIMKAILCGFNPKGISDFIIVEDGKGFEYSSLLRQFSFYNYDTALRTDGGLKSLEGFMGNDIRETSVPFDINRKLTDKELEDMFKYCQHDVEQTMEVFANRIEEFNAKMGLINIFNCHISDMGKTNAQLVAKICGGKGLKFDDEWEFEFAPTLKLTKYDHIRAWYRKPENFDYNKNQKVVVAGVDHVFAFGGIHGAIKRYYGEGIYIMADVTAYYPSMQKRYKWGYRNMAHPENFEKIHDENLRFKSLGDGKARLPYKIADNSISGQLKDKYSSLYDPRENNAICINGQLLLLDLIEKLEGKCELIQSNTDGILIKCPKHRERDWRKWHDEIDDIVYEWEQRTGMQMEFSFYKKVFQKDVNNYLLVGFDGKTKTKGTYTKKLGPLDFDLPIVNKAMVEYMVNGTPIEKTVRECDDLIMFQKIVKLKRTYDYVEHNDQKYEFKCYRVFASRVACDGQILKCKRGAEKVYDKHPYTGPGYPAPVRYTGNDKKDKFGNTPDRCFIDNDDIKGKKVPHRLDREWYIDLAKRRLRQYGVQC